MAKLKKQIFGKVSGAVGDIVFRNRYDSNYISLRPIRFTLPMDERAVARRNKFKAALKLASAMNSIIPLKQVWNDNTSGNNTVFNRMVRGVYPSLVNQLPSENTIITPGNGFAVAVQNIELNQEQLLLMTEALGNDIGINTQIEKTVRLVSVLCLSSPANTIYPDVVYLPLVSTSQNLVLNSQLNITVNFNLSEKELLVKYNEKRLLAGLITFDVELQPVSFSDTIYYQQ